jgi:hypothetical protein
MTITDEEAERFLMHYVVMDLEEEMEYQLKRRKSLHIDISMLKKENKKYKARLEKNRLI